MRLRSLASAALGLLVVLMLAAACLPESPAAGGSRGHEDTPLPTATPGPFPDQEPASRVVEPKVEPPVAPSACRTISERVESLVKASPDAAVYRHWAGDETSAFLEDFNRDHATAIKADEIAIVVSADWGDRAVVLFEHDGCEAGTEQITFSVPGADHEQ